MHLREGGWGGCLADGYRGLSTNGDYNTSDKAVGVPPSKQCTSKGFSGQQWRSKRDYGKIRRTTNDIDPGCPHNLFYAFYFYC